MAQTRSQTKAQEEIKGLPTPTPNLLEETIIKNTIVAKMADVSMYETFYEMKNIKFINLFTYLNLPNVISFIKNHDKFRLTILKKSKEFKDKLRENMEKEDMYREHEIEELPIFYNDYVKITFANEIKLLNLIDENTRLLSN